MLEALTYVAIIVLLPLLPAFLLYKFLPAGQTDVSGPFHGLDIKLSGAFAGYFLVVLLSTSFTVFLIKRQPTPTPPAPPPVYEYSVYTVNGKVDLHSRDPKTGDLNYKQFSLSLEPPERTIKPDGSFSFEIPVQ